MSKNSYRRNRENFLEEFMRENQLLKVFIPLVDFIADIVGPHCEVILHDVQDVENSVVAIRNGYISGRQIGCPLTDLGLEFLERKVYRERSAVINYLGCTASGEKVRSSTFFIKDMAGELIGMLCVNLVHAPETAMMKNLTDQLMQVLQAHAPAAVVPVCESEEVVESLSTSVEKVVDAAIDKIVAGYELPVERMSSEEKISIVQQLNANGIFKIKGAISKVAAALQTSESTIYRYLSAK